jgi:heme-degrading monooxygenase HmoA
VADDAATVMRVFRARVKPGREGDWEALLDRQIGAQLQGARGLLRWFRGRPLDEETHEYVVVTLWRDKDSVRAFAGASGRPVLFPGQADLEESDDAQLYELW